MLNVVQIWKDEGLVFVKTTGDDVPCIRVPVKYHKHRKKTLTMGFMSATPKQFLNIETETETAVQQ